MSIALGVNRSILPRIIPTKPILILILILIPIHNHSPFPFPLQLQLITRRDPLLLEPATPAHASPRGRVIATRSFGGGAREIESGSTGAGWRGRGEQRSAFWRGDRGYDCCVGRDGASAASFLSSYSSSSSSSSTVAVAGGVCGILVGGLVFGADRGGGGSDGAVAGEVMRVVVVMVEGTAAEAEADATVAGWRLSSDVVGGVGW